MRRLSCPQLKFVGALVIGGIFAVESQASYSVIFKGPFGEVLAEAAVEEGASGAALVPTAPAGTSITGWSADLAELDAVNSNMVFTATMTGTGSGYVGTVGEVVTDTDVLARGGDIVRKLTTANGTEYVHIFTDTSRVATFRNPFLGELTVTSFAVGGGGAGGNSHPGASSTDRFGAGGGGGGAVASTTYTIPGGKTFAISVGAGGTVATTYNGNRGQAGATTIFCDGDEVVTAPGGGAGGCDSTNSAYPQEGAAGGGAAYYNTTAQHGQGAAGTFASYAEGRSYEMNAGGNGGSSVIGEMSLSSLPGGGGGAGGAGRAGVALTHTAGHGGLGVYASITGELGLYGAGGGGGGGAQGTYLTNLTDVGFADGILPGEGACGGGRGGAWSAAQEAAVAPQAGAANTGAGGGGAGANSMRAAPRADGVVIIRYVEQEPDSPAVGGVVSTWESSVGTEYLHRFDNVEQVMHFRNMSDGPLTVRYLLVGGGGAGGAGCTTAYSYGGGGGGGGGVAGAIVQIAPDGVWDITVGKGGIASTNRYYTATPGTASSIYDGATAIAIAPAGGAGGNSSGTGDGRTGAYAIAGATGGGDSERGTSVSGTFQSYCDGVIYALSAGGAHASATDKFISDDLKTTNRVYYAAGGGGAGGNGGNGNSTTHCCGEGGVGVPSDITGVTVRYGGGGGAGTGATGPQALAQSPYGDGEPGQGTDGGGTGGYYDEGNAVWVSPTAGTDGLGGGGGGGAHYNNGKSSPGAINNTVLGANGGSGVVYLRYTTNLKNPTPDFATTGNVGTVIFSYDGQSAAYGDKIYVKPGTTATVEAIDQGGNACSCWRDESTGEIFWGSRVTLSPTAPTQYTAIFGQGWVFDSSAGTLSNDGWVFTARVSDSNKGILVTTCRQAPDHGVLNLALPVEAAPGSSMQYNTIVQLGSTTGNDFIGGNTSRNELIQKVREVILPSTITFVGRGAFYSCSNLTGVVCLPEGVKLYRECFRSCVSLEGVFFKGGVEGGQYFDSSNGTSAFRDCTSLTGELVLPKAMSDLPESVFYRTSYESVVMTNVTKISNSAFYKCYGLKSVKLSDELASIGTTAFYNCTNLTSVVPLIPDSVTSIGSQCFYSCPLSADLRLVGVEVIPSNAFNADKSKIETIYAPNVTNVGSVVFKSYNIREVTFGPRQVSFNGGSENFNRLADGCKFYFPGLAPALPRMSVVGGQGCFGTKRPFYKDKHPVFIGDWEADPEGWNTILADIGSTDWSGKTPPALDEGYTAKGLFHFLGDTADNVQYGWLVAMPQKAKKRPLAIYLR